MNEPDEAISDLDEPVGDAPASPMVDPTESGSQGESTMDYAEDV